MLAGWLVWNACTEPIPGMEVQLLSAVCTATERKLPLGAPPAGAGHSGRSPGAEHGDAHHAGQHDQEGWQQARWAKGSGYRVRAVPAQERTGAALSPLPNAFHL